MVVVDNLILKNDIFKLENIFVNKNMVRFVLCRNLKQIWDSWNQLASIVIPTGMEIVHLCTNSRDISLTENTLEMGMAKFESCNNYFNGTNSTINPTSLNESILNPLVQTIFSHNVALVVYYFYVVVYAAVTLNIVEGYLYIKIFRCIKR